MVISYKRNVKPGQVPGWLLSLTSDIIDEYGSKELKVEDYDFIFDFITSKANDIMVNDKHIRSVISVYRLDENAGGRYPIFIARNSTLIQTFYISK